MWRTGDIRAPDFQRNFVWTIQQSSLLIDSFLRGLPVPQAFFYVEEETNKNLVIDGLQRIMSVVYFFDGFFGSEKHGKRQVFKLSGLGKNSPFQGKKFEELQDSDQRKLKNSVLRAINIRQIKPAGEQTVKFHIFERLNTGGTPLKAQEIRNCVFSGEFVELLKRLNTDKNWRLILGNDSFDKHQKDIELVLRVFTFSEKWREYEKPMKEFLNIAMLQNKNGNTDRVKKFEKKFSRVCKLIVKELGKKPFHTKRPLNTAVMDSVFCTILDNESRLVDNLAKKYAELLKDKDFIEGTYYGTSDAANIDKRFKTAIKYLVK